MSTFRYKSAIRSLALTLLVVVTAPFLSAQTPESSAAPSRQERLRVFDQVWRTVSESYHDERFNGVDWRAQRQIFRPLAEMATTRTELYSVLRRMLGTLGDAHTRVYAPEESFDRYQPSGISVGLLVRPIEGRPTVTWVDPDSAAAEAGLRPGYRILAVDGEPARQVLERIRRDIGASSTPLALELQSYERLLQSGNGRSVTIEFADENERTQSVTLQRRLVEYRRRAIPRLLPHRIGYIELTGFGQEVEQQFEQAMEELQETRGLILDLRNNGGGFVNSVLQIASYFFPEQTDLGEFIGRDGRATKRYTGLARIFYRGPVTVLVSARSASGAEILAAAMQEYRRGLVVGVHPLTCGCLLGVSRTIRLVDGGKLNVSDTDFRTSQGRRIEGRGLKPDLFVALRAVDLLRESDQPLLVATDYLERQILFGHRYAMIDFSIRLPRQIRLDETGQSDLRQQ